jgi:hypothetical protein
MESRREERSKARDPSATPKPKRFRIVKLEDRIAPRGGSGNTHQRTCECTLATCICGRLSPLNCY